VATAPSIQRLKALIELALEAIDSRTIKAFKSWQTTHLIEPVLTFDQEAQPALSIVDVESEQKGHPFCANAGRRGGLCLQRGDPVLQVTPV
jgi:hypothetical protein